MKAQHQITEIGIYHSCVEKQQGAAEEFSFSELLRIFLTEIMGKSQNRLLKIIGGKYCRTGVAVYSLKRAPLKRGGKENGVQAENMIQACGNTEQDQRRRSVQENGRKFQIPAQSAGDDNGQDDSQSVKRCRS